MMQQGPPDISVVVPCYRDPEGLRDLLRSLRAQEPQGEGGRFEVIVVDSGADERVAAEAEHQGAHCIRSPNRLLAGEARNVGADHAEGAIVAFIDADCVAEPGWIDAVNAGLRSGAFMVGGPVMDRLPWYTVASVDNLLQFADFGPERPEGPIRHVPSCNMAMRRMDFLDLGGFEHQGQPTGEDVLFTLALNQRWPGGLVFFRAMRVGHWGRRSPVDMIAHQYGFGYARGALGLHLSERHRRLGRWAALIPAVMIKRLMYIGSHAIRNGRTSLARIVFTLPLIMTGVFAWAWGFRRGLRADRR